MKTKLFFIGVLLLSVPMVGQVKTKEEVKCGKVSRIIENLNKLSESDLIITNRAIDSIFNDIHSKISGTTLKDGKYSVSSATVDDKSMTFNYGLSVFNKDNQNRKFIGITGSGTDDNNLKNLFSKDNNMTYSIGINASYFWGGVVAKDSTITDALHKKLLDTINDKINNDKKTKIKDNIKDYLCYINTPDILDNESLKNALSVKNALDDLNIVLDKKKLIKLADAVKVKEYIDCEYNKNLIRITDSLQIHAELAKHLTWVSLNAKYNNSQVSLIDLTSDNLTKSYVNEYFSGSFSWNRFRVSKSNNFNLYMSPTFTFSNPQKFNDSDKTTVTVQTPIQNTTPTAYTVVTGTGFLEIPNRVNVFALEFPITFYFKKAQTGIDFSVKAGVNDPNKNNVSGRLGVFFPISKSGDSVITLEPLLKFQKLFNTSNALFIKDNVVFGFNLSFALPSFFSK